jgi:hypothetical protein
LKRVTFSLSDDVAAVVERIPKLKRSKAVDLVLRAHLDPEQFLDDERKIERVLRELEASRGKGEELIKQDQETLTLGTGTGGPVKLFFSHRQ